MPDSRRRRTRPRLVPPRHWATRRPAASFAPWLCSRQPASKQDIRRSYSHRPARAFLKDLTRADLPRLVVFSQREIPRDTPIEVLGSVVEEEPEAVTTFSTTGAMA